MEVRLNKLISDSGLCSRREADKFIEEGRVTVNGSLPQVGQKVTEADIVMLDDIQIKIGKNTGKQTSSARINIQELELAGQEKKAEEDKAFVYGDFRKEGGFSCNRFKRPTPRQICKIQ